MKKLILLMSVVVWGLVGCVGMESSYKPFDSVSGGYGDAKLTNDVYVVFMDANGFTDLSLTKKYFLKHAAEVTLANDYDCFVVLETKNTLSTSYKTNNAVAKNTKYYSSYLPSVSAESEINKYDANSLAGLVQFHKVDAKGESVPDCRQARNILSDTVL
jgi:hypothetical protein